MSIEEDIIDWALGRPGWQQEVLVELANGKTFDTVAISTLTDRVLDPEGNRPNNEAKGITLRVNNPKQVKLKRIAHVQGVNSLVPDQELTFDANGLIAIYGNNGSGKSGYARIIKRVAKARHNAAILPNVYREKPDQPSADVIYTVDGSDQSQHLPGDADSDLLKMSFYDEYCGDEYLTRTSTITYRPSALTLLDGLIKVCDLVRSELQQRISSNQQHALPQDLDPRTTAGAFLLSVNASTTADQIDRATALQPDTAELLGVALLEETRLRVSDAEKERSRLETAAQDLSKLAAHVTNVSEMLGDAEVTRLRKLRDKAINLRSAATAAATLSFESEPLPEIATVVWRQLWDAARRYSDAVYPDHPFPHTDDQAVCVLCQQPLSEEAQQRFVKFDQYMSDTTERDALAAEHLYGSALQTLRDAAIATTRTTAWLATLRTHEGTLSNVVQTWLASMEERRDGILQFLAAGEPDVQLLSSVDLDVKVSQLASGLQKQATQTDVEEFKRRLDGVVSRKNELQASVRLAELTPRIKDDAARQRDLRALLTAKSATDTNGLTQKTTHLTRQYATNLILDNFTRETERLRLSKVTLEDLGGSKGQLNQRPGLLGAKHKTATAPQVLSEGEQTALGLAGFFTEATFDDSKSSMIFDDPVTSLDHVRRGYVATRLAQFARDRQVIVFTHDVAFITELCKAAEAEEIKLTERSIERLGSDQPGVCREFFPWKAKDFKQRIHTLRTDLHQLRKDRPDLLETEFETRAAAWAGLLSETWERSVSTEVINQVFDQGTAEVRPLKFRLFAQITDEDDKDFREGYGSTSQWARRHDKAPVTNYVAPEPDEMETELDRIEKWQKRVRGYLNS